MSRSHDWTAIRWLAALFLASLTALAQQTPPSGRGALTTGDASIAGRVLTETGQPLAGLAVRAIERIQPAGTPEARYVVRASARTNAKGEYGFERLAAANYVVDVSLIQVTVPRSVANRYMTQRTAPAGVALFQRLTDSFAPLPSTEGTPVGPFLFQTQGQFNPAPQPPASTPDTLLIYPRRVFPDAATTSGARVIVLGVGDQARADFSLPAVRGRRVSGMLSGPAGEGGHLGVRLLPRLDDFELYRDVDFEVASTASDENGAFTFLGVPAGQYTLKVLFVPSVLPGAGPGGPPARVGLRGGGAPTSAALDLVRWAEATVTVGDVDVTDLGLTLRPAIRVSGRIDPGPNPERVNLSQASVAMLSNRPVTISPPAPVPVSADGSFTARLYGPGRYMTVVTGVSGPQAEAISVSGAPLVGRQVLVPDEGLDNLTITLTNPPPAAPPPSADNGFIAGRVIDGETQVPVRGATVIVVRGNDGATRRVLTSDETGAFSYGEAQAGSYTVSASAPGYAPGAFGRMRPDGASSTLGLAARERVTAMLVRLWRFGQIGGRVTDEAGRPVGDVTVLSLVLGGRTTGRQYAARAFSRTDPAGNYRISNLIPGDYVFCTPFTSTTVPESVAQAARGSSPAAAVEIQTLLTESLAPRPGPDGVRIGAFRFSMTGRQALLAAMPAPISPSGEISSYRFACHGSASLADAAVVSVAPADLRSDVDLRLAAGATTSVAGVVRGPAGPLGMLGLRLLPIPAPGEVMLNEQLPVAATISDASGAFTFLGVPPGRYLLRAFTSRGGENPTLTTAFGGSPRPAGVALWSDEAVTVPATGMRDLVVTLKPTARISGRIVFDGTGPPPSPVGVSLQLQGPQVLDPPVPDPVRVTADGTFTLRRYAPGAYSLPITMTGSWRVASVVIDGKPSPNHTIALGLADLPNVELTMTNRFTEVSGRIIASGLRPIEVAIFIFPADYRGWILDNLPAVRMRAFRASSGWTYRATWLPPGDYLAVVYPEVEGAQITPAFIERVAARAAPVTLGLAEKKTLDLTLVSIR